MRAIAVRELGGKLELMELPEPRPGRGEVLVRIAAAGVNPADWKVADGKMASDRPHTFPLIVGVDGAGVVEELGEGATRFSVGDSVYGQFLHDPVGVGTYAELCTVPERGGISFAPKSVALTQAAAFPTAGMTALLAVDSLALSRGERLLIVGASGGVGTFATQLAASRGIHVIATAQPDSAARLRSLGAAETVDPNLATLVGRVKALYPAGVDGLLDVVSSRDGFTATASLVRKGRVAATTVFAADEEALRRLGVTGINVDLHANPELLDRLTREIDGHHLKVVIDSEIRLEDASAALARIRSGEVRGKIVIAL